MNILLKANEIVFERKQEKEREYGPFEEGMFKASKIATELCNKENNLLDAVAYISSLNKTYEK